MKHKLSFIALIFSMAFMLCVSFLFYPKWTFLGSESTLSWDVSGYYFYLPAFFIYDDYKTLDWQDSVRDKYGFSPSNVQAVQHTSGNYVMKYSIGQSVLMAPFFALGHSYAKKSNRYPPDGFSAPYQYAIGIGMLLYALIGLVLFQRVMLLFFNDKISALLIISLVFGSNYLNYAAIEPAMPHSALFMLYCALILLSHSYYSAPSKMRALGLGLLVGFLTITRPTEIISLLIPFLYGVYNYQAFKNRFIHFKQHWLHLVLAGTSMMLIVFVQLIYWKMASGEWVVYSYGEEGFNWLKPTILKYCFNPKAGWLLYTPFLLLCFIGLPFFLRIKNSSWLVISFVLIYTYIVCAWHFWWMGGRAMVQAYPILFISIGAFFSYIFQYKRKVVARFFLILFCVLSTYLNLWWTYQAHAGQVDVMNASYAYYLKTVGRFDSPKEYLYLIDNEYQQFGTIKKVAPLFKEMYTTQDSITGETMPYTQLQQDRVSGVSKSIEINKGIEANYIRMYALIEIVVKEYSIWQMPTLDISFKDQAGKEISIHAIKINRQLEQGEKQEVYIDVPINFKAKRIDFRVMNYYSKMPIRVYSMQAECFNK
jgi:hypothetical protein